MLIGGNIGNRQRNLDEALSLIGKQATIISVSPVYETAAWGKTDQDSFLNQAVEIRTAASAPQLLDQLLDIEVKMGRKRGEKFGPRIIDIDIIFFNNAIINLPQLKIPHPAVQDRRFVLKPLNDIAPGYEHPVLKKNVNSLLVQCRDPLSVRKMAR